MSTSRMQKKTYKFISEKLAGYRILENHRPDWLNYDGFNLELDIFIPDLFVAIEVQGEQHYRFVRHFHKTMSGFKRQLARDKFKRDKCKSEGVLLFEIGDTVDFDFATSEIVEIANRSSGEIVALSRLAIFNKHRKALKKATKKIYHLYRELDSCDEKKRKADIELQIQMYQAKLFEIFADSPESLRKAIIKKSNNIMDHKKAIRLPYKSKRMSTKKRNARRLYKIHRASDSIWMAWGGSEVHVIIDNNGKLECDCVGFPTAKYGCVHCIAIELYRRGCKEINFIEDIESYATEV